MQSFLTVQPGETLGCVGCHEARTRTPAGGATPLAMQRKPSVVAPVPGTPEVFDFPRDIQPILDRHCVDCHGYTKTARGGPRSGGVILTGDHGPFYSHAYFMLTIREQFRDGRNSGGNLPPRSIGSAASPLLDKMEGDHHDVKTSEAERTMVRLWIESAAPYPGTYAALGTGMIGHGGKVAGWGPATEDVLQRRCAECHSKDKRLPATPGDDVLGIGFGGARLNYKDPRFRYSNHILYNLSRPEMSLLLLAPLNSSVGGFAQTEAVSTNKTCRTIFTTTGDPDYKILLTAIQASRDHLERIKRFDMPGFQPNEHYLREMTFYGILSPTRPPDQPVDCYAADQTYWESFIYHP
jgi:mono/diheme cytochrome c family protein